MSESAERWLYFARDDLEAAKALLQGALYNQACFHAQQCAEKALKALIAERDKSPPRTHAITDLLGVVPPDVFESLQEQLTSLDVYYIPTRYPDALPGSLPDGLPGREDAVEAVRLAEGVLQKVERVLSE
jgi:HEPN domain-containing protein